MRSGIVTIIGRPNVGKSSLLNMLVGQKLSIVSHKQQPTRHRIQGVVHHESGQVVLWDTAGLHHLQKTALHGGLVRQAPTRHKNRGDPSPRCPNEFRSVARGASWPAAIPADASSDP